MLPEGLLTLGGSAFNNCANLVSITLPSTLTEIGNSALERTAITELTLPIGVTSLPGSLCDNCASLQTVTLLGYVTEVTSNPFRGCSALTAFVVADDHPTLQVVDGALILTPERKMIAYANGLPGTHYAVPQGVTALAYNLFNGNRRLTDLWIPEGVTNLGSDTFRYSSLKRVTVPGSVEWYSNYGALDDLRIQFYAPEGSLIARDASSSQPAEPFSFRGGVTWVSTPEEVRALEGEPADAQERDGVTGLLYEDVKLSKYTALLGYLFDDGALQCAAYALAASATADETFAYLCSALESLYGEADPAADSPLAAWSLTRFAQLEGGSDEAFAVRRYASWLQPSGTVVNLALLEDDMVALFYLDLNSRPGVEPAGGFDLTGL